MSRPPPRPPPPPNPPPYQPTKNAAMCHASCPQTLSSISELSDAWRSVDYVYGIDYSSYKCDYYSPQPMYSHSSLSTAQWYRFTDAAGYRMPTSAPGQRRCGTDRPGWLSTEPPSRGDPLAAGTVCFQYSSYECYWSTAIQVCACSYDSGATTTYSYKLPRPPGCNMAYCVSAAPLAFPSPDPPQSPSAPALPPRMPLAEGDIRLVGGPSPSAGRVEILHDGEWGTVCGYPATWSTQDANVVCAQLGLGDAVSSSYYYSPYGQGSGQV